MAQIFDLKTSKNENYYKFVNMIVMALVLTFENCSKICGCFNPLSIKKKEKKVFKAFLEIVLKN
jgi:hypothetical protein